MGNPYKLGNPHFSKFEENLKTQVRQDADAMRNLIRYADALLQPSHIPYFLVHTSEVAYSLHTRTLVQNQFHYSNLS